VRPRGVDKAGLRSIENEQGRPRLPPRISARCAPRGAGVDRRLDDGPRVARQSLDLATMGRFIIPAMPRVDTRVSYASTGPDASASSSDAVVGLAVEDLSCASCVARVEKTLLALPGVHRASVNFATGRANVGFAGDRVDPSANAGALTGSGCPSRVITSPKEDRTRVDAAHATEVASLGRATVTALLLTLPVVLLEMGANVVPAIGDFVEKTIGEDVERIVQFVLTSLVLAGPADVFSARAFRRSRDARRT